MSFPKYKGWLFKRPDGWEDLGLVKEDYDNEIKMFHIKKHPFCLHILSVGKENNELFYFCPRCLTKVK